MPKVPIYAPNRNVDPSSLSEQVELLQDVMMDELGGINKRPGMEDFSDSGEVAGVDGVYWWNKESMFVYVTNGKVFKITDTDGTTSNITSDTMQAGKKASFTEAPSGASVLLFMANGGNIIHTEGTTTTAMADADAPTAVTHVEYLDTFLTANQVGSSEWAYSNPNDPLTWDATDSYEAEMEPDELKATFEFNRRLYAFGATTVEPWRVSGVAGDPFTRLDSSFLLEHGCFNRDLITKTSTHLYFMDQNRRVVRVDRGGRMEVVSGPYAKYFQESVTSVSDGYMWSMTLRGHDLILLNFESDGVTFVFDATLGIWYQWGEWSSTGYTNYRGRCHAYSPKWNMHVVGDPDTGKVYKITENEYLDVASPIQMKVRTGWNGWQADGSIKTSKGVLARLKRGVGLDDANYSSGNIQIRSRKNGNQNWTPWKSIDLGQIGDTEHIRYLRRGRGGRYYTKQYEIISTSETPVTITGLWEDVIDTGSSS